MEDIHKDMARKGGARADRLFDYLEFHHVTDSINYAVVIVKIGGYDVIENTRIGDLVGHMMNIHQAFAVKGVTCVMCTLESRAYPPNYLHYIDSECYKKVSRKVNEKLQKSLKGNIITLGGQIFPMDLTVMDDEDTSFESKKTFGNRFGSH